VAVQVRCPYCREVLYIERSEFDTEVLCPRCRRGFVWRKVLEARERERREQEEQRRKQLEERRRRSPEGQSRREGKLRQLTGEILVPQPKEGESEGAGLPRCVACGGKVSPLAQSCPHCGQPAPTLAQPISDKSRLLAGLLGIFLGGLGVHRFYLGYIGIGIIQIILTILTLGLASLWGFIEGIVILAVGMRDAQGRYVVRW